MLNQIRQSWSEAAICAREYRKKNSTSNQLLQGMEAFSWLCAGQPERGLNVITNNGNTSPRHIKWLNAFINLRLGKINEAKKAITSYQNQTLTPQFINETLLLNLWDKASLTLDQYDLAFYYPILPTSLTGLQQPLFRAPYSPPVIVGHDIGLNKNPFEHDKIDADNSMKENKKVFISHSSKQKAFADDLHFMLEKSGYNPVLDSYDIAGGQNIPERITTLISESKYFVLLLTEESLKSSWVMSEITLAYSAGLLKDELLLPVQLSDIDEKLANAIPWIPKNSYNWLDGTKGLRPIVDWLDSK